MLIRIFITALGASLFLFLFWRRLKEDYTQNQIFTTGFYTLFGIALGSVVSDNFFPSWWFWTVFLGSLFGVLLGVLRFQLRILEALDAFIFAELPLIGIVFLYSFIKSSDIISAIGVVFILTLISLFIFFDAHYKRFSWYRSGKVGFSGFTVMGIFFLTRALIAAYSSDVISFVGSKEVVLSAVMSFTAFLVVFNIARIET